MSPLDHNSHRAPVIELAGPAGAGKSTLVKALARRLDAAESTIWGLPVLPLLVNGVRLLPRFGPLWLHARSPLWHETRHVVRLQTLYGALEQNAATGNRALIFDEGPVFALAWLRGFGHETMRQQPSAEWWRVAIRDWSSVIDTILVLDAPDEVLARRIRSRPLDHEVKAFPDHEIARWMARFRESLDWVLNEMALHGSPMVIRVSSEEGASEHMAEKLADELNETVHGR
jgi:thymidylate kinase